MINATKLDGELRAAGIPIDGVGLTDGVVRVDYKPEATQQQKDLAVTIIQNHDPNDLVLIRQNAAETLAASIPNWAGWSVQDWANYYSANISSTQINAVANLADAKVIMNKMATVIDSLAKMEIALRNRVFPKLEDL